MSRIFTLAWTHSVVRTEWREHWRMQGTELVFTEGRVRGSGAGMDPPEGGVLEDGWWVYRRTGAKALRVPSLHLAVSGATGSGWRLRTEAAGCRGLEAMLSRGGQAPEAMETRPGGACARLRRQPRASDPA